MPTAFTKRIPHWNKIISLQLFQCIT